MTSLLHAQPVLREVRYEATPSLAQILAHLGASLLVTTYQAGKLLNLGTNRGRLTVKYLDFEQVMGVAATSDRIAVGTRRQIHFLEPARNVGPRAAPVGEYDHCWSIRTSFYTGAIHGHDLAWGTDGLWVVNTLFSCLCTLHEGYNFVPAWRPAFVTELAAEDRCHLNGLALQRGKPKYVTVLAESNESAGWRPDKASSGCLIDVDSDQIIARGLSMPHSPRIHNDKLWLLDSGNGSLVTVAPQDGRIEVVEQLPGYTRGLALAGQFAFVGLSKIRETSIFGGLPIAKREERLHCGVGIVDLISGRTVATFQFQSGVEEIFAVEVLPGALNPVLFGVPGDHQRGESETWIVPDPEKARFSDRASPPAWRRAVSPGKAEPEQ